MNQRAVWGQLWRLAWPVALTGQLASLAEGINIYWLGHLIGSSALAAEATVRPVLMCAQWALVSIAMGVSVLVAQSVGARSGRGLVYVASGVRMVIVASAALAAIVLPLAKPLASLLSSKSVPADDLLAYGLPALLLMTPGLALVMVLLNAATGAGWTRLATVRMAIDLAVTAALVPVFISVLGLGLAGAPLAQALVQLALLWLVWRTLHAHRERWHLGDTTRAVGSQWREILAIGLPIQLARIATYAGYTYLVQRVANEGRADVVGFGLGLMILFVASTFVAAVGRAVGISLGQAVGARDHARARTMLRTGLVFGSVVGAMLALASSVLAPHLVGLLTDDPTAIARGSTSLHILSLAMIPLGSAAVFMFALTAVKASRRVAVVSISADAIGIAFAVVMPGDALAIASWSIVVSTVLRVILYVIAGHTVLPRSDTINS